MKTLKDSCQEDGITQTELSRRFDIPLRTVQNWHGGQRTPPPYVLTLLEEALKNNAGKQSEN